MREFFQFYIDGFKSMTVGKQLWILIIIKVVIFFCVLKIFFFPDVVAEKTPIGSDPSDTVRNELINRVK
jgi:flagellar basal body-associated protein FliL